VDASPFPPREEDKGSASFPQTYRITVENLDGSTHEYEFTTSGQLLDLGDIIKAEHWLGPTVAIEEIDRHPDARNAGMALAWPISLGAQHAYRPVVSAKSAQ
jgi:hypothetical protein